LPDSIFHITPGLFQGTLLGCCCKGGYLGSRSGSPEEI
jgi:hypothetical protein